MLREVGKPKSRLVRYKSIDWTILSHPGWRTAPGCKRYRRPKGMVSLHLGLHTRPDWSVMTHQLDSALPRKGLTHDCQQWWLPLPQAPYI